MSYKLLQWIIITTKVDNFENIIRFAKDLKESLKPNDQAKRECQVPDIASLRLDSDAARYHWIEQLEISTPLSEEARILRHEPRLCAPSRTYGQVLDPSAFLIIAIYMDICNF